MNVSTDKSIQPPTMVSEKPLVSDTFSNVSPQGPQDVLIYHVADPLELLRILTSKKFNLFRFEEKRVIYFVSRDS